MKKTNKEVVTTILSTLGDIEFTAEELADTINEGDIGVKFTSAQLSSLLSLLATDGTIYRTIRNRNHHLVYSTIMPRDGIRPAKNINKGKSDPSMKVDTESVEDFVKVFRRLPRLIDRTIKLKRELDVAVNTLNSIMEILTK